MARHITHITTINKILKKILKDTMNDFKFLYYSKHEKIL